MAKNFASLAFTDPVKAIQEKMGVRAAYARLEQSVYVDGLTENEESYISTRDTFYMASIGENQFPYIQHRGGPKGFLKVLDKHTLGFIDFRGNSQYITVGNLATHNQVAMILMDYPSRTRLKILARAEIVELQDRPDLFKSLDTPEYKSKPERIILFHVEAYDWNCQQHITPRYTLEEIQDAVAPQTEYIIKLQDELNALKSQIGTQRLA